MDTLVSRAEDEFDFDPTFFRRASSPELRRLCGRLAAWPRRPQSMEVQHPRPTGSSGLCVKLIKDNQILLNREHIDPRWLIRRKTHGDLQRRVPSLEETLDMTVTGVDHHRTEDGAHYVDLMLSEEEAASLSVERARLWNALEQGSGLETGTLNWRHYNPKISLLYIPPFVLPEKAAETLPRLIRGVLPLPVTLERVEFPTG